MIENQLLMRPVSQTEIMREARRLQSEALGRMIRTAWLFVRKVLHAGGTHGVAAR